MGSYCDCFTYYCEHMINKLYKLRQIKAVRVFAWQTFNGFITLTITVIGSITLDERFIFILPFVYSLLNAFTKHINTKYFGDLWTEVSK